MPDLPLIQQIFLGGVVTAFAAFIVVMGGTYYYVNRKG